jgi:hypothetical protein
MAEGAILKVDVMLKGCCCAVASAGTRDIETVATTCGLTRLLDLDLDSPRLHATSSSSSAAASSDAQPRVGVLAIAAAGAPRQHEEPLALARAAAALQRLVVRCAAA